MGIVTSALAGYWHYTTEFVTRYVPEMGADHPHWDNIAPATKGIETYNGPTFGTVNTEQGVFFDIAAQGMVYLPGLDLQANNNKSFSFDVFFNSSFTSSSNDLGLLGTNGTPKSRLAIYYASSTRTHKTTEFLGNQAKYHNTTFQPGTVNQLTVTFDHTTQTSKIYQNGTLFATSSVSGYWMGSLMIGMAYSAVGQPNPYSGYIQSVKYYTKALSAAEVSQNAANGTAVGLDSGPVVVDSGTVSLSGSGTLTASGSVILSGTNPVDAGTIALSGAGAVSAQAKKEARSGSISLSGNGFVSVTLPLYLEKELFSGKGTVYGEVHGLINAGEHDSRSEYILLASELAEAGFTENAVLQNLSLYVFDKPVANLENVRIGIRHTTETAFSDTLTSFPQPYSAFTQLFSASSVVLPASQNWMKFNFSVPFTWNGTSNLHLVLIRDAAAYYTNQGSGGWRFDMFPELRYIEYKDNSKLAFPFDSGTLAYSSPGAMPAIKFGGEVTKLYVTGAASLSGTGTLTAGARTAKSGNASASGAGTLTASGVKVLKGSAALSGTGSTSSTAMQMYTGSSSLTAAGALSVSGVRLQKANAAFAGTGTLSADVRGVVNADASLSGNGTLAAQYTRILQEGVNLSGTGTSSAVGFRMTGGTSNLSGTGAINGTSIRVYRTAASAEGTGTISAASGSLRTGGSVLTGTGTLSSETSFIRWNSGTLNGSGTAEASASYLAQGISALSGKGTVDLNIDGLITAEALLSGMGSLSGDAVRYRHGSGVFSGESSLSGEARRTALSGASLNGMTSLNSQSTLLGDGRGTMAGQGTLGADAWRQIRAEILLAANGTVQTGANRLLSADSELKAISLIQADSSLLALGDAAFTGVSLMWSFAGDPFIAIVRLEGEQVLLIRLEGKAADGYTVRLQGEWVEKTAETVVLKGTL
jgi:Concanavalin A-like lectin/glucanases superfamily